MDNKYIEHLEEFARKHDGLHPISWGSRELEKTTTPEEKIEVFGFWSYWTVDGQDFIERESLMASREKINELREEIEYQQEKINNIVSLKKELETRIDLLYAECKHIWTNPYKRTQTIVDFPRVGDRRDYCYWERECESCGKIETTRQEITKKIPVF